VLLVLLVALTAVSPRFINAGLPGEILLIKTPDLERQISLKEDGQHVIEGPLGKAILVVRDGKADLKNAPCPLKICERMGPIENAGEVILCIPNRISIKVSGEEEMDAVTR
jgi:hypothetical protein